MGGHISEKQAAAQVAELVGTTCHGEGQLGYQKKERGEENLMLTVLAVMHKEMVGGKREKRQRRRSKAARALR